jgi:hypothetical protein
MNVPNVREMWTGPAKDEDDLHNIWHYALTVDGYEFAKTRLGKECGDLANERLKQYQEDRKWTGTFEELRCCLFFEQRRWRHFGNDPEGQDLVAIRDLYRAVCEQRDILKNLSCVELKSMAQTSHAVIQILRRPPGSSAYDDNIGGDAQYCGSSSQPTIVIAHNRFTILPRFVDAALLNGG